jgi:hypothetical protein
MTERGADDEALLQLAKAIASGSDVDWKTAETSVGEDPVLRDALAQLKIVEQLATVCRSTDGQRNDPPGAPPARRRTTGPR